MELWGPFQGKPLLCGQGNLEQTVPLAEAETDSTKTPRNTVEFFTVIFPEIKEFLQNLWWLGLVLVLLSSLLFSWPLHDLVFLGRPLLVRPPLVLSSSR